MSPLARLALIAAGGALGALARYGAAVAFARVSLTTGWPVGTWVVNAAGCFAIGLVVPFVLGAGAADQVGRLLVVVGFLGAFTTFSTYSLETLELLRAGRPLVAAANALGSVAVGLALVVAGAALARLVGAPA